VRATFIATKAKTNTTFIATQKTGVFYYESSERSDRCYYITYKIGSTKKREKVGWKSEGYTQQIAADIRAERLQQIRHGKMIVRRLSFKEGMDSYLNSIKEKPSYQLNKKYLEKAAAFFGYSTNLNNISSIHIVEYIGHLKSMKSERTNKRLSDQTIVHYYNSVRHMYNYLIDLGLYTGQTPLNKKTRSALPKVNNTVTNFLSDSEYDNLVKTLENYHDEMLANFFLFALYTGVRLSEIFDIKIQDINIKRSLLFIPAKSAKSKQDESLEISGKAMKTVIDQLQLIKDNNLNTEYIFCKKDGSKRKEIKVQFDTLKRKAGIKRYFRFHDLRHNFATMLVSSGTDIYIVQQSLNHKDPKTTQRYAHLKTGMMRGAVDKAFNGDGK
jgi:site-specific recombinase XerD